ncbi:MAG: tripartite tricarboxylate transporter substrate binding protein [Thermodesulfobacteriota bacterium]
MRTTAIRMAILTGIGLVFCLTNTIMAQEFPTRSITMTVPYGPGGATDLTTRPLCNAAKDHLGQPIIVENKPGAGGVVGATATMTKPGDGYNLCIASTNALLISSAMGKLGFHPVNDVTPIMRVAGYLLGFVVNANSPWQTFEEFVKYCKANPKQVSVGFSGIGSTGHVSVEELSTLAGIQLRLIPHKGGDTNAALLGNHIDVINDTSEWAPLVDAGKFRVLAVYSLERSARFPQVRTFKEIGYNIAWPAPIHIFGPKGIPKPVVEKLHAAFKKTMDNTEFKTTLKQLDMPALYMNPGDTQKFLTTEYDRIDKIVKKLGLDKN